MAELMRSLGDVGPTRCFITRRPSISDDPSSRSKVETPLLQVVVDLLHNQNQNQPKSNSVHFSLKIWQLVATIFMIVLKIKIIWPVYRKIFLSKKIWGQNTMFDPRKISGGSFDHPDPQFPRAPEWQPIIVCLPNVPQNAPNHTLKFKNVPEL